MFKSFNPLKFYKNQPALEYLRKLEEKRTPIRLEMDHSNTSFYTLLMLRNGRVIIAKPPGSVRGLSKGATVRFRIPFDSSKEILLTVTDPHFTLLGGNPVFLCQIPDGNAEPTIRSAERYNTTKFGNLFLLIPELQQRFRVIDISYSGCKVLAEAVEKRELLGFKKTPGRISVEEKFVIEYDAVIPRFHSPPKIGFQLSVAKQPPSKDRLTHLLDSLHKGELSRLKIKSQAMGSPKRPP